ncbi:DUF2845 domain-containing protein [Pseudomonas sp. NP21570]|nr:DUF2845 domain-containing protein [Pseudomonas sp. NP21570]
MKSRLLFIGGLLLLCQAHAYAETLRCPKGIVSTGDRSFEVLNKCGEPINKAVIGYVYSKHRKVEIPQEEWVYTPGGGMQYFLLFEGNTLRQIESSRGN